ncbi:hypothetical protein HMPREF2944_06315 [Rothia sp. HMSC072E10]|nr:hypothetical protein HMPREF2944_06315 [Rothia sp. HMSC072E10]
MLKLRYQSVQKSRQYPAEVTLTPTLEVKDNDSAYDINKKAARYARRNGRLLFKIVKPHQAVVMPVAADIT